MLNATETAGLGRRRFRLGMPARDTLPVPKESAFDTFAARLQMGVGAAFAGNNILRWSLRTENSHVGALYDAFNIVGAPVGYRCW